MTDKNIGTLHLYIDANDLNNYIHSHLRPEDMEAYKNYKFVASRSSVNEQDFGIDIMVFSIDMDEIETPREMQLKMDELGAN